jgi:hypothetical protein
MRRMFRREATVKLAMARLAVRFVPTARILAWASRAPRRLNRFAIDDVGWVSWAVDDIGSRSWMRAACLPRALAAQAMLRRRGIASRLCLGVAREPDGLSAHAWIELGQNVIVGGAEKPRFTRLVEFGGERA